jgi:SAM-dependent methyltransferase
MVVVRQRRPVITSGDVGDIAKAEADLVDRFREYYLNTENETLRELERRTLGVAYGGNGYTDVHQVERFMGLLDVGEGDTVLELGSGAGWPGLHIARATRSNVVLSDVPWEGVAWGLRRGRADDILVEAVACLGTEIPFKDGSFDGVTHSDVMC